MLRPLSCVLACAGLLAAEPALRLTVPDTVGAAARVAAGPFGAAWAEAAVAKWYRSQLPDGADAAWAALPGTATSLRAELRIGQPHGGLPAIGADVAVLAPRLAAPARPPEVRWHRLDAWTAAGLGPEAPALPAPAFPGGQGDADAGITIDVPAWCRLLPPPLAGLAGAACARSGLAAVRLQAKADAEGVSERSVLVGAHLPLRAIDPAALAGLPDHPVVLVAFGLDGKGLAGLAKDVLGSDAELAAGAELVLGQPPGGLAEACDGTVAVALCAGNAGPEWIASLPRREAIDALFRARVAAQAPDAIDAVLAASDEQPVAVAWPGLGHPLIRRTPTRWLIGTSPADLGALGGGDAPPYPLERLCPEAAADSQMVAYADLAALAPAVASPLPPARAILAAAIRAAAPHLPPLSLALAPGEDGLVLRGHNGLGLLLPLAAVLPAALPALAVQYHADAQAEGQMRMARLVARARNFADATSGHWPRDLTDLRAWAPDLGPDAVAMAGRPDLKAPFCYVAPRVGAQADQPVLVQDPSCNGGAGSLVGYVSGAVRYVPGELHWREACRLAATDEARAEGVDASAWATMPRTF